MHRGRENEKYGFIELCVRESGCGMILWDSGSTIHLSFAIDTDPMGKLILILESIKVDAGLYVLDIMKPHSFRTSCFFEIAF